MNARNVAVEPGSAEWQRIITPSKVAAILGVSRWESPYRLWMRMKGLIEPDPPKDEFDVGHDMEPAMAAMWRRKNPGWRLSPGEIQTVTNHTFGYPSLATIDRRACRGRARRVVEFKTARRLEDWGDFGTDQAPADYVAQVLAQMAFTGYTKYPAHLMVLGPFFEANTYVIDYAPAVVDSIHKRCRAFWDSLAGDAPPELDDTVPTYEAVRELHPDIDGTTVEVDFMLGVNVHDANDDMKVEEKRLLGLKTQLLDAMGAAQYAVIQHPSAGEITVATRGRHAKGGVALNLARKHPALQAAERREQTA